MFVPNLAVTIDVTKRFEELTDRVHNEISKKALREELEQHGKQRIRGHFEETARAKYGYKARNDKYRGYKRRRTGSLADLVFTGKSRSAMTKASGQKIRIGGTGAKGTLIGRLIMRFPFPGGTGRTKSGKPRRGVTIQDMISELRRFTPQEEREIATGFRDRYLAKLRNTPAGRRRIKLTGSL